jgi:Zn finger protein HypA/HybF involved in hydrogenase expression
MQFSNVGIISRLPCRRCKTPMLKYKNVIKHNDAKFKCPKCKAFTFR